MEAARTHTEAEPWFLLKLQRSARHSYHALKHPIPAIYVGEGDAGTGELYRERIGATCRIVAVAGREHYGIVIQFDVDGARGITEWRCLWRV